MREDLRGLVKWFFLKQVNNILKKQRVLLTPYKSFEPKKLVNLYQNFQDEEYLLDQCAELLSKMILVQAFPNANHRTAFFLVGSYLSKHGIRTIKFEDDPGRYQEFYKKSKGLLETDIDHMHIFDKNYLDAIHMTGIDDHLEAARKQLELIIIGDQSGIKTEESLQSFTKSLSQLSPMALFE